MKPELEIGAGFGEFGFDCSDRFETGDVTFAEFGIGVHFLFGEMNGLGEDAVARGVQTGALFAFGGSGAFAVLRIQTVSAEAGFRTSGFFWSGRGNGGLGFVIGLLHTNLAFGREYSCRKRACEAAGV